MPLTDVAIRNASPVEKPVKLFDSGGLYLLVQPTGGKLWRFKYRYGGREKLLALGSYPEVTLGKARQARTSARELLDEGVDPSEKRKTDKRAREVASSNTFADVAGAWWKSWKSTKTEKHAAQVWRWIETDMLPEIGDRPITEITAPHLVAMALKVEKRGAEVIARRTYQISGQVFRYAVAHGITSRNPAADVRPGDALKPRRNVSHARLDAGELPKLMAAIDVYDGSVYTRLALKLLTLTFVRTTELTGARWNEFDLEARQWRIPSDRMKMRTPHIVPLSKQALAVLDECREVRFDGELLFPNERNPDKPMSNNTMLFALYKMGYHSRMTGHGFRGLASTVLHELGYRHDVIELQLAHQERDRVSAAYNHATYLPQRAELMQAWADHLDALKVQEAVTT